MTKLILLRHGESIYNKLNLFTGWTDVPLSKKGIKQAIDAGQKLKKSKTNIDIIFTSELVRAHQTLFYVLEELNLKNILVFYSEDIKKQKAKEKHLKSSNEIPIFKTIKLNERHYGDLQGFNKDYMREKVGKEQVHLWRRSFDVRPPHGESLKDTLKRVLPYFKKKIIKALKENNNVLIVAHGNSLRAITKYLENISNKDIPNLEIPLGTPIIYELDKNLNIIKKTIL